MNQKNVFLNLQDWEESSTKNDQLLCNLSEGVFCQYPNIKEFNNWVMEGFDPVNNKTVNLLDWYGVELNIDLQDNNEVELTIEIGYLKDLEKPLDALETRKEEVVYTSWKSIIVGGGSQHIIAPFRQFDHLTSKANRWRFVRSVRVSGKNIHNETPIFAYLTKIGFKRRKSIHLECPVVSKSAKVDKEAIYELTVTNCESKKQAVVFTCESSGWEVMNVTIQPKTLILDPGESKGVRVNVQISERVTPGGFEKQVIHAIPNGDGSHEEIVELITSRYLPHPYIIHTENGWKEVKEKSKKDQWAKEELERLLGKVEKWRVPEVENGAYMFYTHNAHIALDAAIAWKLTDKLAYAEKSALFIKRLIDPDNGYPKRKRACHQELVHEGEFFKSVARAYDLVCDLSLLTDEDHQHVEKSFRIFIDLIDWNVKNGNISNWSLAELTGAINCSQALQDRERMERFLYQQGGVTEHLAKGTLDDGWWYECSIGYNLLCAGLLSEISQSCKPWGINLADQWVPASYSKNVNAEQVQIDGLVVDIWGPNIKNYRSIQQLWDSLLPFADYRGVVFGVSDATEMKLPGKALHFDSRYDLAYYLYRKPEYADILRNCQTEERDILYGITDLPESQNKAYSNSAYVDNAGVAVLRSQKDGREQREQIQAAVKYGSHGGAHGHYDRASLMSIMRYGRSFYNPENIWYGYKTFLYKFYVQNSITHNMVTVDLKLQDPVESKKLVFHSGKMLQACAVETNAKWSHPPYGGWMVNNDATFAERSWNEGRYVPIPEKSPEYSTRTEFTEPILQRRFTLVTDDYVVNFDYVKGEKDHVYDCIYHMKGLKEIDASEKIYKKHTAQLTSDLLSSAQFVTDCDWYEVKAPVRTAFEMEFGSDSDTRPNRTKFNEDGILKMDFHTLWPKQSELIVGCDPEYDVVQKQLWYEILADNQKLTGGKFGAWILGRDDIDVSIEGMKTLQVKVKVKDIFNTESKTYTEAEDSIFLGNPYLLTKEGKRVYFSDLPISYKNINLGNGIGRDYFGGPVKIAAEQFDKAIPANPLDKEKEGYLDINLEGLNAERFVASIGGDYPLGDETHIRKTLSTRVTGKEARFMTIVEPHEDQRAIVKAEALSKDKLRVLLADGRVQEIEIVNLEGDGSNISATIKEISTEGFLKIERTNNEEGELADEMSVYQSVE